MSSLLKNVSIIGGLTLVSRMFGFARDMLLSHVMGAGGAADAWQLAFQLPNIFRRLFAEGAFASAFVPLFNRRMQGEDGAMTDAQDFASQIMAVLIPILIAFSALFLIGMPWVMGLFASDALAANPDRLDLAVLMARIAFPYLAFMSLATLFAAVLNSLSRFAAAAAAPILLNICLVVALLIGSMGDGTEAAKAATGQYLAIAVSISGLLQLVWLFFWMRRSGFRLRLQRPRLTGDVRELGVLILPAIFGAGVYQISRFIDLFFLSSLPDKSITFLALADRLNQLPLGIIGIALSTAILPTLSRFIAQEDVDGASRLQSNAVELAMLLTLPAAVALLITGPAIASAFYVGGAFSVADGAATGAVVAMLVVGLPAYVLVKVLIPNFFARKDTRTPVYTAAFSLLVNIGLNFLLIPRLGVAGLALAGSLAAWSNLILLIVILRHMGHFTIPARVVGRLFRIMLATTAMAFALWLIVPLFADAYIGEPMDRMIAVVALCGSGAIIYFSSAWLLGVIDPETIGQLRRRRV